MHNSIRIILAITVILLFGFSKPQYKENNPNNKSLTISDTITWKLLGDIKYTKKKHATYGEVEFPQVNLKLKMLNKKEIIISGFVVPIDSKSYALSKNVFAACFFCGKSGPETIMGIHYKGSTPRLKTDTYVTLKGKFRYNETDVEDWIYHIDEAEIISKK